MPSPRWAIQASRIIALAPARIQQQNKLLHILRAQLRECTYLPDSQARFYMRQHVLDRWRAYHPRSTTSSKDATLASSIDPEAKARFSHLAKLARKALVHFRKATEGHVRPLLSILLMTYGRKGRRRRDLLASLTSSDVEPKSPDLIRRRLSSSFPSLPLTTLEKLPRINPAYEALLHSHTRTVYPDDTRSRIKRLDLEIASQNAWARPMPQIRIINTVKRWYASILERTLPPLPEQEWNRLKRLSSGALQWEGPRFRRARAKETTSLLENDDSDGVAAMTASDYTEMMSPELQHQLGLINVTRTISLTRPHTITHRFMRRLWLRVFQTCPMMKWDERSRKWDVQWGGRHVLDATTDAATTTVKDEEKVTSGTDVELPQEKQDQERKERRPTVLLKVFEMHGFGIPVNMTQVTDKRRRKRTKGG